MQIPESRDARYSLRGKAQTSYWKAKRVADQSLSVRIDPSIIRKPDPKKARRITESVNAQIEAGRFRAMTGSEFHERDLKENGSYLFDPMYVGYKAK